MPSTTNSRRVSSSDFDAGKAAQIEAWFAHKESGKINILKLMKLMYLAERKYIECYKMPMLMDKYVSMKHGPVLSETYDLAKGEVESTEWDEWIEDIANYSCRAKKGSDSEDYDALSRADLDVLQAVWDEFGRFNRWELRDKTHDRAICPEWEYPGETSKEIPMTRLLHRMNIENSDEVADEIESYRILSGSLHSPA